ncbi:MAG TPA: hypothetical protein VLV83_06625 [Acidobacteriota bacterium]|nr:hypothetical protein [Acidobacteriota bacterium]
MQNRTTYLLILCLTACWLPIQTPASPLAGLGQEAEAQDPPQQEPAQDESQDLVPPTDNDQDLLQLSEEILQRVVKLRGLEVKKDIVQEVKSREQIRAFLLDKMVIEYPDEELEKDEKIFQRLGLLSEKDDLKTLVINLLTAQVAGFYDPHSGTFSIADWIPEMMQKPVMAHELLHALQDQHFDLEAFLRQVEDDDDQFMARQAVVEGEGVAIMLDYMLQPMGQQFQNLPQLDRLIEQAQKAAPESAAMGRTPAFLKDLLFFPYIQGASFVRQFRLRHSWEEMAGVYQDPPRSSEQIMHPEKYFDERDDPTEVEVSQDLPQELQGSWRRVDDGTLGQYMISRLMTPFIKEEVAEEAARGWDGDRFEWFEAEDGRNALRVRTVWDSQRDALEFHQALIKTLRARTGYWPAAGEDAGAKFVLTSGSRVFQVQHDGLWVDLLDYDRLP